MANETQGGHRGVLLAGAVIAATVVAILMLQKDDGAQTSDGASDAVEQIDATPLLPEARISSASWNQGGAAETARDQKEPESLIDGVDWEAFGEDPDKIARRKKHLEKVIEPIDGLGVVVAPPGEDDGDDEEKNQPARKR